jgi:uncharacterized protein
MKDHPRDPRALNVSALCKDGAALAGSLPLAGLPRLASSFAAAADGAAQWQAQGTLLAQAGAESQVWLHIEATASVPLQCQRCLSLFLQPLVVDRRIRFVRSEEEAARLDEVCEDDVLALPTRLDLHELLEDELILALPIVPRHAGDCPQPLVVPSSAAAGTNAAKAQQGLVGEEEAVPHPFAALAALRGRTAKS